MYLGCSILERSSRTFCWSFTGYVTDFLSVRTLTWGRYMSDRRNSGKQESRKAGIWNRVWLRGDQFISQFIDLEESESKCCNTWLKTVWSKHIWNGHLGNTGMRSRKSRNKRTIHIHWNPLKFCDEDILHLMIIYVNRTRAGISWMQMTRPSWLLFSGVFWLKIG